MCNIDDDTTYRVEINPDTKHVEVMCFGIDSLDTTVEGTYMSVMELPDWMKNKLAVLDVLPSPPPRQEVEDVGARVNDYTFWVFRQR